MTTRALDHPATGLVVALLSAATFGMSGSFARPLLESGWSPGAAVAVRTGAAGLVLAPLALAQLRGRLRAAAGGWKRLITFGVIAVAGAQLCFFAAVQRLPVGVAILIEFQGPVLLIALGWFRTRVAPPRITLIGAAIATAGLAFVLDLTGGADLDPVGLLWATTAAFCVAGYFLLSATSDDALPPVALASGGLLVGAVTLVAAGLTGVLPFDATTADVDLFGTTRPWWVPMAVIVVASTAFAYATGIFSATRLGARVASFVALFEVLFAVLLAWLLLDERPTAVQAVGGALIVVGIVLVRSGGSDGPAIAASGDGGEDLLGDEAQVIEIGEVEDLQIAPFRTS